MLPPQSTKTCVFASFRDLLDRRIASHSSVDRCFVKNSYLRPFFSWPCSLGLFLTWRTSRIFQITSSFLLLFVALLSIKQLYLFRVSKNPRGSIGVHIIMTPTNTFYYFWVVYILVVVILHHWLSLTGPPFLVELTFTRRWQLMNHFRLISIISRAAMRQYKCWLVLVCIIHT